MKQSSDQDHHNRSEQRLRMKKISYHNWKILGLGETSVSSLLTEASQGRSRDAEERTTHDGDG